jgi:hypothetical protein
MTLTIGTQQSWAEWLRGIVPIELAGHIVHVVPKESELVVFADTPAWCARLRYAVGTLAPQISARDATITRTTLRVQPASGAARIFHNP